MSKLVTLKIDGQTVTVPEGTLIVDAAKKIGIDIPVFCYHPKMEPVGMCRMCLVEVGRPVIDRATGQPVREVDGSLKVQIGPKLETACTTPVTEGMIVIGASDKVTAARKEVVEFILTSHPLDCPVCDKGGECPLQNLTMKHGPGESRFIYDDKMHLAKHVALGELIYLDRERCIQCGRCVRFQSEIADDPVIGFFNRGRSFEIVTYSEPGFDSYFSGNTTDICPVGALTTADFRFGARPWELRATASICSQCPVGCNITFNVRREAAANGQIVIKRVMPRQNEAVNEIWMCDKGRFAYQYTEGSAGQGSNGQSPSPRLTQPLIRKNGELTPATWDEALDKAAAGLRAAGKGLLTLGSGRLANEDLFNLPQPAAFLGGKTALYTHMAGGDLVAQVGVGQGTNFAALGKGALILVVASDLQEEAPIWFLRIKQAAKRGAILIVANPRPTKLDRYATQLIRYAYGTEATTILAMVNALSAKRPELPGKPERSAEVKAAAEALAAAENAVVLFGSEGTSLESSKALAQACANLLITTNHTGRANNGLIGVWSRANDQGAWDMGLRPLPDLRTAIAEAKALYVVAADPFGDEPSLLPQHSSVTDHAAGTAGGEPQSAEHRFLVVQDLFLTETAKQADVVLPAQAYTEREGTYTSGERRVQRFYPATPGRPEARPDFAIIAQIGARLGLTMESQAPARVLAMIAAKIPAYGGLNYRKLAETAEQWPVVGRGDMYYGGTAYENKQGLGIQLAPAAQRGEPVSLSWPELPSTPSRTPGTESFLTPGPSPRVREVNEVNGELKAVPITRLYDRGQTVLPSTLLHQRIPKAYIVLNPEDAARLNATEGAEIRISLQGTESQVIAQVDASCPAGVVLVPRSMGLPISGPAAVEIRVTELIKD